MKTRRQPKMNEAASASGKALPERRVKRQRLHEQVALQIEDIIRDNYKPGDPLPSEREFMELFDVGRSAVREALTLLSRMGLVVVRNGEKARVAEPTAKAMIDDLSGVARLLLADAEGIHHFQEARALLEIGLVRIAAQQASDKDLQVLRALLDDNRDSQDDSEAFLRSDEAFHIAIAKIGGNPIFTAVYTGVVEWLDDQRNISAKSLDGNRTAYQAHEKIYAAIAAHDPVTAEQAMEDHLTAVAERYWRMKAIIEA
ncbi:FCD domain-containing protein [Thalassospira mesophila]|uniref:FCD domain-containing protein n=1 Tax=Thalassospira mesophila TaxID=1293891 RepID=UPI00117D5619|nr:FCD domain-containing protein [Thalassospira mesophila]